MAHKVFSSFHSTIMEMVSRAVLVHDIAAGVCVGATSRYDTPVDIPSEKEIQALLSASDRLANSRNLKIQQTWEKYRPMLYLAVGSGMLPQEYLVLPRSSLKDTGVEVDRALEGGGTEITVTKRKS